MGQRGTEQEKTGYLFVHFIGEQEMGEQIYFSVSEDGLHFRDLAGGRPVLISHLGDQGVRDPFLVRNEKNGRYYLIATDLRIGSGKSWEDAQYRGSRDIIVWESEDLINWGQERSCRAGVPGAGCVWAPESVYLPEENRFFVFFASMVKLPGDEQPKQRIYGSYTEDFREFSEPFLYMEADNHVIDLNIVSDGTWYYRFVKDETTKRICLDRVKALREKEPAQPIEAPVLAQLLGVEGPEAYRLPDGSFCLIVDQFAAGKGYLPLITEDLASGLFTVAAPEAYDLGKTRKRHGGVIRISREQLAQLEAHFGC